MRERLKDLLLSVGGKLDGEGSSLLLVQIVQNGDQRLVVEFKRLGIRLLIIKIRNQNKKYKIK